MKKTTLTLFLALLASIAFSQENSAPKKQFIGFASSGWFNNADKASSFSISPKYGYYFAKNWAIGATIDFSHSKTTTTVANTEVTTKINSWGVSPFVRFKHLIADKVVFFNDFSVQYSQTKTKDESESQEELFFGLRPGLAYILCDNISVAAYFGRIGYYKSPSAAKTNQGFGYSLSGNGLGLGLNYHF